MILRELVYPLEIQNMISIIFKIWFLQYLYSKKYT